MKNQWTIEDNFHDLRFTASGMQTNGWMDKDPCCVD